MLLNLRCWTSFHSGFGGRCPGVWRTFILLLFWTGFQSLIHRSRGINYTDPMMDELDFRCAAEGALETLKQYLFKREEDDEAGFEVEEQNGVLNVLFDKPEGKFVITPNAPVRQIWISALSTSFKLDFDEGAKAFVLPKTGEQLIQLIDRLIGEHLEG